MDKLWVILLSLNCDFTTSTINSNCIISSLRVTAEATWSWHKRKVYDRNSQNERDHIRFVYFWSFSQTNIYGCSTQLRLFLRSFQIARRGHLVQLFDRKQRVQFSCFTELIPRNFDPSAPRLVTSYGDSCKSALRLIYRPKWQTNLFPDYRRISLLVFTPERGPCPTLSHRR